MGCFCSCLEQEKQPDAKVPTNVKTPLLSGATSAGSRVRAYGDDDGSPRSARQHPSPANKKELVKSIDELRLIEVQQVGLQSLDKTFQDHAKLFNSIYNNHKSLRQSLHSFKEIFLEDTDGIPVLSECMKALLVRVGSAELNIIRKHRFCLQIEYDIKKVSKEAKSAPEDSVKALELLNKANKLIKDVLERAPHVRNTIELVLNEEQKLRTEVSKADLGTTDGPIAMKNCVSNINRLRSVPSALETIERDTTKLFQDMYEASKVLIQEKS